MRAKRGRAGQNMERQIIEALGYDSLEDGPQLERVRREIKSDQLNGELTELADRSQKKKRRLKENLSGMGSKSMEGSEEMKELEWRLQVLREDRREMERRKGEPISFQEMYNRQKNKYLKFRNRQNTKVNDPKYLDMIGSTQMRREKRRLASLDKVQKHIEMLDINIGRHMDAGKNKK